MVLKIVRYNDALYKDLIYCIPAIKMCGVIFSLSKRVNNVCKTPVRPVRNTTDRTDRNKIHPRIK